MPTTTSTTLSSSDYPVEQTNQIDVDDEISMLEGSVKIFAPQWTRSMKKAAKSQKVEWLEDEAQPVYTLIATTALASGVDTAVGVTAGTGQHFKVNDILHIETTGENIKITAIATDALTVVRSYGTTAGAAAAIGVGMVRVANASPQGASYPTPKSTVVLGQYNLQQIIRTSFAMNNTSKNTQYRGETDPVAYQKAKHLKEHLREIENTIWLGQRFAGTSSTTNHGTQPQLTTAGIDAMIVTNKTISGGTITAALFETWLRTKVFAYGEIMESKLVVVSPLVAAALSGQGTGFAGGKIAPPSPEVSKWGVRLRSYQSVLGDVNITVHPDWRQYTAGAAGNGSLGGSAYALDMDHIYLKGFRTTQYLENRQAPGDDAFVAEYLTEFAVVLKQERLFAKYTGITG